MGNSDACGALFDQEEPGEKEKKGKGAVRTVDNIVKVIGGPREGESERDKGKRVAYPPCGTPGSGRV